MDWMDTIMKLDSKIPEGDIRDKWEKHKFNMKLVNPANKHKYHVICVGTGLAGASASASMAELDRTKHFVSETTTSRILSLHKVVSTRQKIIATMATVFGDY